VAVPVAVDGALMESEPAEGAAVAGAGSIGAAEGAALDVSVAGFGAVAEVSSAAFAPKAARASRDVAAIRTFFMGYSVNRV
jgi:hypothetical protein